MAHRFASLDIGKARFSLTHVTGGATVSCTAQSRQLDP
jgi:hypothetical protein